MSITKIEKKVVDTYKAVEDGITGAYRKAEDGVIGAYKKIEEKFVEAFLARDGESSDEAKKRIIAEQAALIQRP